MRTSELSEAKVYVGTYAKYNNSSIKGEWLDLNDYSSKEEFYEACKELHSDEEDPEFMFQDFENIPASLIGESWISEKFWEIKEALENIDMEAFNEFLDWRGNDLSKEDITDLVADFEECYNGAWDSEEDFTENLVDELGMLNDMPENLKYYFDYEKYSRDLFMGDYYFSNGHVFRAC